MQRKADVLTSRVITVLPIIAVLALWEFASATSRVNPIFLPRPTMVFGRLWDLIVGGEIFGPLFYTFALFAAGYTVASVLGIAAGIAMATSRLLYGLLEPIVEIMRPMPKSAVVPVLFLFLGIGKATMVTIVALAAFFPVLISAFQGARSLDPVLLETARTFRKSRFATIFGVILPAALPMILAGMRTALGIGLVLVILAEMLAGEDGIGFRILDLQRSFQIPEMFAWTFVLVALGGGLMALFDDAERRLVPWRGKTG